MNHTYLPLELDNIDGVEVSIPSIKTSRMIGHLLLIKMRL